MDVDDGLSAGSKRPLESEHNSKSEASPPHHTALAHGASSDNRGNHKDGDNSLPQKDGDNALPQKDGDNALSTARAPGARAKSSAAPPPETLMSYELVRHQIQRRLHFEKISQDAIHALVPDVEFRLFQLLQEADRFRRRCRRSKLLPDDINSACRLLNVDPLYGFCSSSASLSQLTSKAQAQSSSSVDASRAVLSLEDVLDAPLPPCPLEPSLRAHWLAASGVQPVIEENLAAQPPPAPSASSALSAPPPPPAPRAPKLQSPAPAAASADATATKDVSQELFLFFEKVSNALVSGPEVVRSTALHAVSNNPGLQPLLPYLVQFISDEVVEHIKSASRLAVALRLVSALISSPHLHIEPFAHQIMPAVITCIVCKALGGQRSDVAPFAQVHDHWFIRDSAVVLVVRILQRYGAAYPTLIPRTMRTLLHALLDPSKPFCTHFGALSAISTMSPHSTATLLLPHILPYLKLLSRTIPIDHAVPSSASAPSASSVPKLKQLVKLARVQQEASFVYCAILKAVGLCIRSIPHLVAEAFLAGSGPGDAVSKAGVSCAVILQLCDELAPGMVPYLDLLAPTLPNSCITACPWHVTPKPTVATAAHFKPPTKKSGSNYKSSCSGEWDWKDVA